MKTILKVLGSVLLLIIVVCVLVLIQQVEPEQVEPSIEAYDFPDTLENHQYSVDSLKLVVGTNKGLPKGFETQALLAYSAYPELKDVAVDMVLTQSGAPMESNFDFLTLLGSRSGRKYRVLLNNAPDTEFDEILLRSLPFDAQVGILAHELGHVVYYDQLTTLEIAKWGVRYLLDEDFRSKHEKSTDMMPVYHGLGSQIYQYAYHVRHDPSCAALYQKFGKEFIDKFYMTDIELRQALRNR